MPYFPSELNAGIPDSLIYKDTTPFAKEYANRTGEVNPQLISELAYTAGRFGVDPYTMLGIALQENNLQLDNYPTNNWNAATNINLIDNVLMDDYLAASTAPNVAAVATSLMGDRASANWEQKYSDLERGNNAWDNFTRALDMADTASDLKINSSKYKDELKAIQAHNGFGKVRNMYGKKGITDMSKDPVYAKRVQAYANDLKNNKDIGMIVNQSYRLGLQNPVAAQGK